MAILEKAAQCRYAFSVVLDSLCFIPDSLILIDLLFFLKNFRPLSASRGLSFIGKLHLMLFFSKNRLRLKTNSRGRSSFALTETRSQFFLICSFSLVIRGKPYAK